MLVQINMCRNSSPLYWNAWHSYVCWIWMRFALFKTWSNNYYWCNWSHSNRSYYTSVARISTKRLLVIKRICNALNGAMHHSFHFQEAWISFHVSNCFQDLYRVKVRHSMKMKRNVWAFFALSQTRRMQWSMNRKFETWFRRVQHEPRGRYELWIYNEIIINTMCYNFHLNR